MLMAQQQCPRCDAAIFRENATVAQIKDHRNTYVYCEICGYGIEVSVYDDGDVFTLDYVERTEPKEFAEFLERLSAARAA